MQPLDRHMTLSEDGENANAKEAMRILAEAGLSTIEDLIDMARVGSSLISAINEITSVEGPYKGWAPAENPAEIVFDLYNDLIETSDLLAPPSRKVYLLQQLVEEFGRSGYQTHEHMGHVFARIEIRDGEAVEMTDVDLTRLASEIAKRSPK